MEHARQGKRTARGDPGQDGGLLRAGSLCIHSASTCTFECGHHVLGWGPELKSSLLSEAKRDQQGRRQGYKQSPRHHQHSVTAIHSSKGLVLCRGFRESISGIGRSIINLMKPSSGLTMINPWLLLIPLCCHSHPGTFGHLLVFPS